MLFKKLLSCTMAAVIAACSFKMPAAADTKADTAAQSVIQTRSAQGDVFSKDGLLFTELDDGTYEVGYDYNDKKPTGKVTIPSEVDGRAVTRIAEAGFANCGELTEVIVPDSIISAGANAFYGTPFLNDQTDTVKYAGKIAVGCDSDAESAVVKDGTLGLADRLFCSAENITAVTLPEGLMNLGAMTFQCCAKLSSVNLPDGLKEIGSGVFAECSELRLITIPDSVTSIGSYAFYKSKLSYVTIPESVTTIGKGAFENSYIATNGLTIGNGYINIGGCAFNGTPFYAVQRDVKYAGSVLLGCSINTTELTIREGTTAIADLALSGRENLTSVTIPNSVKTIGSDAFFNCPKLTKISIPKGVESIGKDAFRLCGELTEVSVPQSVKTIGAGAFYGCSKIKTVNYSGSAADWAGRISIGNDNTPLLAVQPNIALDPKKPSAVTGLAVTDVGFDNITLSWKKSDIADSYRIEVLSNENWKTIGKTSGDKTTFTINKLDHCTSYKFRVTALARNITSTPASVSTKTKVAPVTGAKAASTHNSITLSWQAVPRADQYEIDIFKDGKWTLLTKTSGSVTSYKVTGLSQKTAYQFKIYTFVGNEYSASVPVNATTTELVKPQTVTGLKAASGTNSVTLSWNKTATADSYEVDIYKGGKWVCLAKVTGCSYTASGLSPNTSYDFKVFSFKENLYSNSAAITAKTISDKPETVTGLKASSGTNSVTLSWNKTDTADSYEVDIYKGGKWVCLSKVTGGSYTANGLSPNTSYDFKVFSFRGSKYSNSASITARTASDKPLTVTGLKASSATNSVTLSWNKTATADSYEIDMYKGGKWVYVAKVTGGSYTVSGLSANTSYEFKVFSFKGSQYSSSANVSAKTASVAATSGKPQTVTGLKASSGTNSVTLSWNKTATADSYEIDMYKGGKWVYVAKVTGGSYTVSGLSANTSYDFKVFSFKGSQYSSSANVSAKTASVAATSGKPQTVTGLKASGGTNSITLSWDKTSTADSYEIDMYKNGRWEYVAKITGNAYLIGGLSANTSYDFKVFSFKGSQYSNSASISAKTSSGAVVSGKPQTVTRLKASSGTNSVTLSWDKTATADSYEIDMYKNGKWVYVAKVTGDSYTVSGLSANTSYDFKVFSFKGSQFSNSASVSAKTSSGAVTSSKPQTVTGLKASSGTNSVTLSWDKTTTADSYEIDMYKGGKWVFVAKVTGGSYTVTGLSADTLHYFKVFSFKGSQFSNSASINAKTTPNKPETVTGLRALSGANSITLSWNATDTADSYEIDMYKNGKWVFVAKVTGSSYTVTDLSASTYYNFKVFSFKGSQYSNSAQITANTTISFGSYTNRMLAAPIVTGEPGSRVMMKGIDVSGWQGEIDFKLVKQSGVDFVIVKAGEGPVIVDTWEKNYANAKEAGLKVGAYWFCTSTTIEDAKEEAQLYLKALNGKKLDFPVYLDMEVKEQFDNGKEFCTQLVETFCSLLESKGYYAGVYCSTFWYTNYVDDATRLKRPNWIAQYDYRCKYTGSHGIWQYGKGEVEGVEFDCDLNWGYFDYSAYIRSHNKNGF